MFFSSFLAVSIYVVVRLLNGLKIYAKDQPISGQIGNVQFTTNGTDPVCRTNQHTFQESQAFAESKGGRLCTSQELQSMIHVQRYLSSERSYAAAMEAGGQPKWVGVGYENKGEVLDARNVKWSDNYNYFEPKNMNYPFWVGNTLAWCPASSS